MLFCQVYGRRYIYINASVCALELSLFSPFFSLGQFRDEFVRLLSFSVCLSGSVCLSFYSLAEILITLVEKQMQRKVEPEFVSLTGKTIDKLKIARMGQWYM